MKVEKAAIEANGGDGLVEREPSMLPITPTGGPMMGKLPSVAQVQRMLDANEYCPKCGGPARVRKGGSCQCRDCDWIWSVEVGRG